MEERMQQGMDARRLFLCLIRKLWLAAAGALLGAVLAGGVYYLKNVTFAPEPEYRAVSKFYLDFAYDEKGRIYDYYNGYTWNDLMDADLILDLIMEELPAGTEREAVAAATKAEIISDSRLLTVTVTSPDAGESMRMQKAVEAALVRLGDSAKEFRKITPIHSIKAELNRERDRTKTAVIMGAVVGAVISLFVMAFYYVLEDSLYVEADVRRRFGVPSAGLLIRGGRDTAQPFAGELLANLPFLCGESGTAALTGPVSEKELEETVRSVEAVFRQSGEEKRAGCALEPVECPFKQPESYERIRRAGGVFVAVPYGRGNGRTVQKLLEQLETQECRALGILITDADAGFVRQYYREKRGKRREEIG